MVEKGNNYSKKNNWTDMYKINKHFVLPVIYLLGFVCISLPLFYMSIYRIFFDILMIGMLILGAFFTTLALYVRNLAKKTKYWQSKTYLDREFETVIKDIENKLTEKNIQYIKRSSKTYKDFKYFRYDILYEFQNDNILLVIDFPVKKKSIFYPRLFFHVLLGPKVSTISFNLMKYMKLLDDMFNPEIKNN